MFNINLLNQARLENDLDSLGCLDIAEELIEKMMEDVFYSDVAQRIIVQTLAVIDNANAKLQATFNILEDEDMETDERSVEFEGISYYE
ncbi:hypothetical protein [Bacillus inaquosorum]|uniref:hypothetical protein n=1 Tax=Bacillus inaquosorum TaxID=483913 RepID=UPI00227E92CC|nr:hypothetical protein [Bacillus inaquosorum]MCY7931727.1 hypothetical protein [Bacillus inaquosorum]MCY8280005.1 hypothetical protein [Bacillus inaquosorum]MCY8723090.1 hypothetical protein [Bacillus inaquosorum]MCY8768996.1 hypothetical protein [Bacillus inaquosorum]MCY9384143.1 hypothetical protein [Bacillus inaquosorum]